MLGGGWVPNPRRVAATITDSRLFLGEPVHVVLHELEPFQ